MCKEKFFLGKVPLMKFFLFLEYFLLFKYLVFSMCPFKSKAIEYNSESYSTASFLEINLRRILSSTEK